LEADSLVSLLEITQPERPVVPQEHSPNLSCSQI
jgi:hypothetical protein